jgi:queuine tRNA-ribosyltransferase
MVLDVCPGLPAPPEVVRTAVERTAAWAGRARRAHRREGQALFGIVQGGVDARLRAESARRTVELDFDGYGIGGLSVGEPREQLLEALAAAVGELPDDRPRYLMGVGDPLGLVEAVALGVDQFDCVLPTRLARHGSVLTSAGRLQLRNAAFSRDDGPLDPNCTCPVCGRWSRGYLRHLLSVGEPSGARLVTLHNLAWLLAFVEEIGRAVRGGTLERLRRATAATWS